LFETTVSFRRRLERLPHPPNPWPLSSVKREGAPQRPLCCPQGWVRSDGDGRSLSEVGGRMFRMGARRPRCERAPALRQAVRDLARVRRAGSFGPEYHVVRTKNSTESSLAALAQRQSNSFNLTTPEAWRYSPRSAAPHRRLPRSQRRYPGGSVLSKASLPMHLVPVFIVAVGLYVLGMIVLALVAILGSVRGKRELKKRRLTV